LFVQGNYDGQLDNTFGQLFLKDASNATVASTTYGTPPFPGDYDASGTVDTQDYNVWMSTFGSTTDLRADGNFDGVIDAADYAVWRAHLGATNPGAGAAALAASSPVADVQSTPLTVESMFAEIGSTVLTRVQKPLAFTTQQDPTSLADTVFRTWAEAHDRALLAAASDIHINFHRPGSDATDGGDDDAAATDCALSDLVPVELRVF
jgi:hypothetical protein